MNAQEWYAHETGEITEPEALLEDFEAHQVPLSAGDEVQPPLGDAWPEATNEYPGQGYFHKHNPAIKRAEQNAKVPALAESGETVGGAAASKPRRESDPNHPTNGLEVLQALEALLEACPTSCEDRALIDAQRQAEQAIRRARV